MPEDQLLSTFSFRRDRCRSKIDCVGSLKFLLPTDIAQRDAHKEGKNQKDDECIGLNLLFDIILLIKFDLNILILKV